MKQNELIAQLKVNRERCERIEKSITERARKLSQEAGLHGEIGNILHNAIVSESRGHPWPEVDYKKAKKAQYILSHAFDASRVADKWYTKNARKVEW